MADSNQNFVTNNVTIESDEVIKFVNPFKNHQQHQIEDFSLFLSVFKKCRCCFSKFISDSDQHTVESWHRQAFLALTGVELVTPDSENFLCMKCVQILKIFTELGKTAANLQKQYHIVMQDLASDIKTERDETDEVSGRLQDYSDIVISDNECASDENNQIMQQNIDMDAELLSVEKCARLNECSVRLTRIDPETIDKYEYYSVVGSTEEQMIYQTSSTFARLKITSQKESQNNATLKIIGKTQVCCPHLSHKVALNKHDFIFSFHKNKKCHNNRPRPSCDLCGKTLTRKQTILKHMRTYHMNVKFSCHLCSAEFESSAKLRDHNKIVHSKYFKCEECDAAFGKSCLLLDHVKAMHTRTHWYCHYQECSSSFALRYYAIRHLQRTHSLQDEKMINNYLKTEKNDQSNTKCQICGMIIAKTRHALYEHFKKTHSNTIRFSCDLCGQTFAPKQKMNLIDHMYKHQVKVKFNCSLCPAEFQSNLKLLYHENHAHKKKFKCEKCDASFIELKRLKKHVKVEHAGKLYNCQVPGCSKSYVSLQGARYHLYQTHSLKGEKYRKYRVKMSPRVEIESEVDSKCQICGKILKNRRAISRHIRLFHNKDKSCDFCGKTFSLKRILLEHMQTYHMELMFNCNLCSLEFRSEKKLKDHIKSTHDKNFKCDKCNLAFSYLYRLNEHVKVKHDGKRYHCSYPGCSISFTAKSHGAKHLIVAHSLVGENFNKFNKKLMLQ